MSEMSTADASSAGSTATAQRDGGGNNKLILGVVLLLLVIGIVGGVVLMRKSGSGEGDEGGDSGDGDGGGGGGGGGGGDSGDGGSSSGSSFVVPSVYPAAAPPGTRQELICTVGLSATIPKRYPSDGGCQYLYYTHVFMSEGKVLPTEGETAFTAFLDRLQEYKKTEGGLSFDIRYVDPEELKKDAAKTALSKLSEKKILHLGSLNIQFEIDEMTSMLQKAKDMLKIFKDIQGADSNRKTIVALGTYDYGKDDVWQKFVEMVKSATQTTFNADTVILLSSTGDIRGNTRENCTAVPPNAIPPHPIYPSLSRLGELVKKSFVYENAKAMVGLSLQMGTMLYNMNDTVNKDKLPHMPYSKCVHGSLVSQIQVCKDEYEFKKEIPEIGTIAKRPKNHAKFVTFSDDKSTITTKLDKVLSWPARSRFAWLLLDVHFLARHPDCKETTLTEILNEVNAKFPRKP